MSTEPRRSAAGSASRAGPLGQPSSPGGAGSSTPVSAAGEPAGRRAPASVPRPVDDRYAEWMGQALARARAAGRRGEVPVGAVVVDSAGVVIGEAANAREGTQDPTAHAEVLALRAAARHTGSWRLVGCTLVVTLEPCAMCAGAIVQARVPTLVFGARDPKAGGCGSVWDLVRDPRANHRVDLVQGVLADACEQVLRAFFHDRRRGSQPDTPTSAASRAGARGAPPALRHC